MSEISGDRRFKESPIVVLLVGVFMIQWLAWSAVVSAGLGWWAGLSVGAVELGVGLRSMASRQVRALRLLLIGFGGLTLFLGLLDLTPWSLGQAT